MSFINKLECTLQFDDDRSEKYEFEIIFNSVSISAIGKDLSKLAFRLQEKMVSIDKRFCHINGIISGCGVVYQPWENLARSYAVRLTQYERNDDLVISKYISLMENGSTFASCGLITGIGISKAIKLEDGTLIIPSTKFQGYGFDKLKGDFYEYISEINGKYSNSIIIYRPIGKLDVFVRDTESRQPLVMAAELNKFDIYASAFTRMANIILGSPCYKPASWCSFEEHSFIYPYINYNREYMPKFDLTIPNEISNIDVIKIIRLAEKLTVEKDEKIIRCIDRLVRFIRESARDKFIAVMDLRTAMEIFFTAGNSNRQTKCKERSEKFIKYIGGVPSDYDVSYTMQGAYDAASRIIHGNHKLTEDQLSNCANAFVILRSYIVACLEGKKLPQNDEEWNSI